MATSSATPMSCLRVLAPEALLARGRLDRRDPSNGALSERERWVIVQLPRQMGPPESRQASLLFRHNLGCSPFATEPGVTTGGRTRTHLTQSLESTRSWKDPPTGACWAWDGWPCAGTPRNPGPCNV